jgi:hypothetical protein
VGPPNNRVRPPAGSCVCPRHQTQSVSGLDPASSSVGRDKRYRVTQMSHRSVMLQPGISGAMPPHHAWRGTWARDETADVERRYLCHCCRQRRVTQRSVPERMISTEICASESVSCTLRLYRRQYSRFGRQWSTTGSCSGQNVASYLQENALCVRHDDRKVIAVYCETQTKRTNTQCGQTAA